MENQRKPKKFTITTPGLGQVGTLQLDPKSLGSGKVSWTRETDEIVKSDFLCIALEGSSAACNVNQKRVLPV